MRYPKNVKWWQIALVTLIVSGIGALSAKQPKRKGRDLYEKDLKQAPWAPPGWVFGPAWTFNNLFLLMALNRILRGNHPQKNVLLSLQAAIWVIYFSFGYVYFQKRSPVLAAVWTVGDALLAISSITIAARHDRKLAANYLPLVIWTSYASTVAMYQALNNSDTVVQD